MENPEEVNLDPGIERNTIIPMRTSIILDDELGEKLREAARSRGISLSAFLAEAGRAALEEKASKGKPFQLIIHDGGGVRPGINLDKTGALQAAEDEREYRS